MSEHTTNDEPESWSADFQAAEEHAFEASLAATPSQRLAWLEEALRLAYRVGALGRGPELPSLTSLPARDRRPDSE